MEDQPGPVPRSNGAPAPAEQQPAAETDSLLGTHLAQSRSSTWPTGLRAYEGLPAPLCLHPTTDVHRCHIEPPMRALDMHISSSVADLTLTQRAVRWASSGSGVQAQGGTHFTRLPVEAALPCSIRYCLKEHVFISSLSAYPTAWHQRPRPQTLSYTPDSSCPAGWLLQARNLRQSASMGILNSETASPMDEPSAEAGPSASSRPPVTNPRHKLTIISNRLPVSAARDANGKWDLTVSAGGLVSALLGVSQVCTPTEHAPVCCRSLPSHHRAPRVASVRPHRSESFSGREVGVLWLMGHSLSATYAPEGSQGARGSCSDARTAALQSKLSTGLRCLRLSHPASTPVGQQHGSNQSQAAQASIREHLCT